MVFILLVVVFMAFPAWAQEKAAPAKRAVQAAKSRPCPRQPDPQLCERGWQLLDASEGELSGSRESGIRAYGQLQVARAYAPIDRGKAIELLNRAFTAARPLPDGNKETVLGNIEAAEKADLQRRILENLVTLAPEQAEEKLLVAFPSVREPVFAALIGYYQKDKRFDAAMDTILRIARDAGFPYMATNRLLAALPPEGDAQRQQLFTAALNSFRTHPPEGSGLGFDAGMFPDLIVQHWKRLSTGLVREAIDEVLKQEKTKADEAKPMRVTVGYARGGGASLASVYEYRLFQLLPVLRQIDPGAAESLLRDHQMVANQFDAYVQAGSPSIRSVQASSSGRTGRQIRSEMRSPAPGESSQEVVQRIMAVEDMGARATFLLMIARREQESNPSMAKACLDKLVDPVAAQLPSGEQQVSTLIEAAGVYLEMKENAGATKAISAARGAADKLYAEDNDSRDPNKALKCYWPSTVAYSRVMRLAGRVSRDLAFRVIDDTRDDEIRSLMRLALAEAWIGVPTGWTTIIRKDGTWSQESDPEALR